MIQRPDLQHMPEGCVIPVGGVPMRHLGGGAFAPATLPANDVAAAPVLAKRFEPGGPLLRAG